MYLNVSVIDSKMLLELSCTSGLQVFSSASRGFAKIQKKQNLLNHIIIIPSIKEENIYGLYLNGVVISLTDQEILYNNKVVIAGGVGSYQPFFNNIFDRLDLVNEEKWLNNNEFKYYLLVLLNILRIRN